MRLRLSLIVLVCVCPVAIATAGWAEQKNLVPNASFEVSGSNKLPVGWSFNAPNNSGATCTVDDSVARSGRRSVKLVDPHAFSPNVYGTLACTVRVKTNTVYTLSLYAKSADPGRAWFGCGKTWEHRQPITATGDKWERFSLTFKTGENESTIQPRINVDSTTKGVWIDDVQLEVGEKATAFEAPMPLEKGQTTMIVRPVRVGRNLLKNGSFEEVGANGVPVGWQWQQRNTDAKFKVDDTVAHSGKRSFFYSSTTPFQPQVYSLLWYLGPVKVKPNTTYTFSAFIKSDHPGPGFFGGGRQWLARAGYPSLPTHGRWVRTTRTWTTAADETEIPVMCSVEGATPGMWIDDVKLEEGGEATPSVGAGQTQTQLYATAEGRRADGSADPVWMPDLYPPGKYIFAGWELAAKGQVVNAQGDTVHARLTVKGKVVADEARKIPNSVCASFELRKQLSGLTGGPAKMEVWLEGHPKQRVTQEFTLVTPDEVMTRLAALQPKLAQLAAKAKALRKDGGAYVLSVLTIGRQFTPWIKGDVANSYIGRAYAEVMAVQKMVDETLARKSWPSAPKLVSGPMTIDGPSFVAEQKWPDGKIERRPTFFVGMGAFTQVRKDVPILPDYGMNIIQIEFGPNSVLPTENTYSDASIKDFLAVCSQAEKAGVKVNLLISPHYFPAWAMKKWPHLADANGGFLRYDVYSPHARAVLEKFLRYAMPKVVHNPALHSICLSNEPMFPNVKNSAPFNKIWHAWLRKHYATVADMNAAWGGEKFKSFDAVPNLGVSSRPSAMLYDFVRCNQEAFANWHKFMADIIHEYNPNLPVHAKMTINPVFSPNPWGNSTSIAPELFAKFCEIDGNDGWKTYSGRGGQWATDWQGETMGYELQRSARNAPVFNSEDHIIPDRNVNYQPPSYIYDCYWQGAMHGRGASTTWVWERTYDTRSDFWGSILERPQAIEAVGRACLDLNRLSPEVTALEGVRPKVAVLYGLSGLLWDHDSYPGALGTAYRVSTFLGQKTGFVYERQLEALADGTKLGDYLRDVKVIVLPQMAHLSAKAQRGLEKFVAAGGKIIALGTLVTADEHDQPTPPSAAVKAASVILKGANDQELGAQMAKAFAADGVTPPVELVDRDGKPAYGIDYWGVPWHGGWLVNLANYANAQPVVRLRIEGKTVAGGTNLINGGRVPESFVATTLMPKLVYVK